MTNCYLTGYSDTDREEMEAIAADAADRALDDAGVSFEAAMRAEACRTNEEEYDAAAADAYVKATAAAQQAFEQKFMADTGGRRPSSFVTLGWR